MSKKQIQAIKSISGLKHDDRPHILHLDLQFKGEGIAADNFIIAADGFRAVRVWELSRGDLSLLPIMPKARDLSGIYKNFPELFHIGAPPAKAAYFDKPTARGTSKNKKVLEVREYEPLVLPTEQYLTEQIKAGEKYYDFGEFERSGDGRAMPYVDIKYLRDILRALKLSKSDGFAHCYFLSDTSPLYFWSSCGDAVLCPVKRG